MPKCRGGDTGEICSWIYDVETRGVMDYNDWVTKQTKAMTDAYRQEGPKGDPDDPGF
jgi:hypothetical protein